MRSIKLPFALIMLGLSFAGCASMSVPTATRLLEETGYQIQETTENPSPTAPDGNLALPDSEPDPATAPVSARRQQETENQAISLTENSPPARVAKSTEGLDLLIAVAWAENPKLDQLDREYRSAVSRSEWMDQLPDPRLGANVFINPIETAAGSQRAALSLSQTIPWLDRLNAEQRQACLEAMALRSEYLTEKLRLTAEIRVAWHQLFLLDKQVEIAETNRQLLESLLNVANARIATGNASQGDVLLATLELSKLEQQLLSYRQQRRTTEIEINRRLGRSSDESIDGPTDLSLLVPELDAQSIFHLAKSHQPALEAARLRLQAAQWGITIARLKRRPEMTLSASYFPTDDNRLSSSQVDVGQDPWSLGLQVTLPWSRKKYEAIAEEASLTQEAAQSSLESLEDQYEAKIGSLVTEATRAADTANLHLTSILPQARQTLAADQKSYASGAVEFDRVIQDYRSLLILETGYYQAMRDLAVAVAQLQQAAGTDLKLAPPE